MSHPAVQMVIRGLKCDAEGCDFMDPEASPDERSLNRPCPKCGANLLTEADLANVRLLQYVAHSLNVELGPSEDDTAKQVILRVHMDGSGDMTFEDPAGEIPNAQ